MPNRYRFITVAYELRTERPQRPHVLRWPTRDWYAGCGLPEINRRSYPTRAAAMRYRAEIEREINDPACAAGHDRTWAAAVAEYAATLTGVSRKHRYDIDRCLAEFGKLVPVPRLSLLTAAAVDQYFNARTRLLGDSWTNAQHRKEFSILRAFFNLHTKRRALAASPISGVRPPIVPRTQPAVPSDAQWMSLLHAVSNPAVSITDRQSWHLYILAAAVTGLDQMDLLKLKWLGPQLRLGSAETDNIGLILWQRTKSARRGVPPPPNCIGLPAPLNERLATRLSHVPDDTLFVFPWRSFQRKQWETLRGASDFPYPFKALRRVAATRVAESAAVAAAAVQLGHSSPEITRRHYVGGERVALAAAARLSLPDLPPLPAYSPPGPRIGEHRPRRTKSSDH